MIVAIYRILGTVRQETGVQTGGIDSHLSLLQDLVNPVLYPGRGVGPAPHRPRQLPPVRSILRRESASRLVHKMLGIAWPSSCRGAEPGSWECGRRAVPCFIGGRISLQRPKRSLGGFDQVPFREHDDLGIRTEKTRRSLPICCQRR